MLIRTWEENRVVIAGSVECHGGRSHMRDSRVEPRRHPIKNLANFCILARVSIFVLVIVALRRRHTASPVEGTFVRQEPRTMMMSPQSHCFRSTHRATSIHYE